MDRRAYEDKAMRRDVGFWPCDACGRAVVVAIAETDGDLLLCTDCKKQLAHRRAWRRKQAVRA